MKSVALFKTVCAWCGVVMVEGPADAATSHSICPACVPKFDDILEDDGAVRDESGRWIAPPQHLPVARPMGPWNMNSAR